MFFKRIFYLMFIGLLCSCEDYDFKSINHPPNAPGNPSPANGATGVSTAPTLSWTCSDPDNDGLIYDVYFGTSSNPTTAIATGQSATSIATSGLSYGTTYYWKIVARDNKGNFITSSVWNFTSVSDGTVTDIDGNVYHYITIGTQTWMVENLKTTRYRNGDAIPNVTDGGQWSGLTTGAYCNYNNDANNATTYGRLYNWYAVIDSRKIAPAGWHVATDNDWQILVDYVGGSDIAGTKLKSTSGWYSDGNGTNDYGFTALPGGYRYYDGTFANMSNNGLWWSSTEYDATDAWYRGTGYAGTHVGRGYGNKKNGFSIRCVRDN